MLLPNRGLFRAIMFLSSMDRPNPLPRDPRLPVFRRSQKD